MLSREADSLFWMGRYLERAEATARIVDVQYHAALESPLANPESLWNSILEITGDDLIFQARYGAVSERDLIQFMIFDPDQPDSVVSCIRAARANAQGVREVLSSEMWEVVNRAFLELLNWDVDKVLGSAPHQFLVDIRNRCHLFYGLAERTMLIGDAWFFLRAGMFLERADQMSRLTDVLVRELTGGDYVLDATEHFDTHGWIALFEVGVRVRGVPQDLSRRHHAGQCPFVSRSGLGVSVVGASRGQSGRALFAVGFRLDGAALCKRCGASRRASPLRSVVYDYRRYSGRGSARVPGGDSGALFGHWERDHG
jgi:hypothetical protein